MYRYHHMHLLCSDLEEMIRFFTEDLGAALVARRKFGAADGATLDLEGLWFNLRVAREGEEIAGDGTQSRLGYDHLGLTVDDLGAAYEALREKGYQFTVEPRESEDSFFAFFRGPDNILIELIEPKG